MAIWLVTVRKKPSRREVAMLALPKENRSNPGVEAQRRVKVGQFDSGASMSLYDKVGNEYLVDDAGQLYVPLGFEQIVIEGENEEENKNGTKN